MDIINEKFKIDLTNKFILDACCGGKMFWFDKSHPNVLYADCRKDVVQFTDKGKLRRLEIKPDVIHDFTQMPYPDKSFKCVIFDPPHLIQGGKNAWLVKKYGKLNENWRSQLKQGFQECMRVLDEFGTLIFKWNETQIPVSQILQIIEQKPLIGHKSGRANQTHWLLFMKISNN